MRGTDATRRSAEVRVPSANIFSLYFSSFFDASGQKGGNEMGGDPVGRYHTRPPAGWRSTIRDARFKNARRTLCQCCLRVVPQRWHGWQTDTRGYPAAGKRLFMMRRQAGPGRATTGSRAAREMPGSIDIACAESTIAEESSRRGAARDGETRVTGACALCSPLLLIPACDAYARDPVYISNATIFGNSLRDEARSSTGSTHSYRWIVPRIRGRTDHWEPPSPVIKLSSLNS